MEQMNNTNKEFQIRRLKSIRNNITNNNYHDNMNKNVQKISIIPMFGLRKKNKEKYTFSKPFIFKVDDVKIHLKNMSWKGILNYLMKMTEYKYDDVIPISAKDICKLIKKIGKVKMIKISIIIKYNYSPKRNDDEEYIPDENNDDYEDITDSECEYEYDTDDDEYDEDFDD